MIEDGGDGFLCKVGDSNQWVDKIEWLIKHPVKRNEMAQAARNSYEAKFNVGRHVPSVVDFIYGDESNV
jgi:glycosyltransferase involved in cell wall biosynthesis